MQASVDRAYLGLGLTLKKNPALDFVPAQK